MRSLLRTAFVVGLCVAPALANPVYVNTSAGNDAWDGLCDVWDGAGCGPKATIQAGIDAATAGDEVIIAAGTYTGAGNRDIDYKGKVITVRSSNPADGAVVAATVIDCLALGRGFYFHTAETAASVLDGVTITHGSARDGGGIHCYGASPTVRRCRIIGNTASGNGGGVFAAAGTALFADCVIGGNSAGYGGGLATLRAQPTMQRCVIAGNAAAGGGGVSLGGGGITYRATLANCLVVENGAQGDGGGLEWSTNTPRIANCIFSGNHAGGHGGGIWGYGGSWPYLWNCIAWGNTAPKGAQIGLTDSLGTGVVLSVGASDVAGGQAGVYLDGTAGVQWDSHNIDAGPLFVDPNGPDNDPATWQDNDYHLTAGSPCVNTGGPPVNYPEVGTTDIDGQPRVLYNAPDMGADEFAWYGDFQYDGDVDMDDFGLFFACFNGPNRPYPPTVWNCTPADADRDRDVDLTDFGAFRACFNGPNRPPACP